jgi:hypothetical protein
MRKSLHEVAAVLALALVPWAGTACGREDAGHANTASVDTLRA